MAQVTSQQFKSSSTVKLYLLKSDGTVDTSVAPITATVRATGFLTVQVPYDNGETFLLVGTSKVNLEYSERFKVADTTAPIKPVFTAEDDVGPVQGAIKNNTTIDDKQPLISGTSVEKAGVVKVFDQGVEIGSATVNPDGSWSFTPTSPLAEGKHVITVQQYDGASPANGSLPSDPLTFTVDTVPVKVDILTALDNVGLIQGEVLNNGVTDDPTPKLQGTGSANAVVHISENGTDIGSVTADAAGNWAFELPAQADGTHKYTATISNDAGNSGSAEFTLTIDTQAPTTAGVLAAITDDSGVVGDFITNDPTLVLSGTITGTLVPEDKVQVSVDGGTTWVDAKIDPATNTWSLDNTATPLTDGQHDVVVRVIDQAGNIGPLSTPQSVVIDTQLPTAQANVTAISDDTGIANDFITSDTTLVINGAVTGTLAATEKVEVRVDGGTWAEATLDRANNTWSFDNTASVLAEGAHKVETRVIDAAGNATAPVAKDIQIDTTKPVDGSISISGITEDTGTVGDYITNDKTLIINGSIKTPLAADEHVQISLDDGVTWKDAVLDRAAGTWSYDNTANELSEGKHTIKAQVIDVAGNTSSAVSQVIEIDTTISPPDSSHITFDGITEDTGVVGDFSTSDNTLVLFGKFDGAADERVQVSLDGTTWVEAKVDPVTKTWSYDNTANKLADGSYTFSARIIDVAGNTTAPVSHAVEINTAPLEAGTIKFASITEDTGTPADFITSDKTLIIGGEIVKPLHADERVQVSVDGTTWVDATLDRAAGTWSYDNTANELSEGSHTLQARVINSVGITSPVIDQVVIIDTIAPEPNLVTFTGITEDTGVVGDYITNDDTLVLHGAIAKPLVNGDHVQVSLDGGATWVDAKVDPVTNTWSYDNTANPLAEGTHTLQVHVIDVAGNVSAPVSQVVTIDKTISPPDASHITFDGITEDTGTVGDFNTSDNTLVLFGKFDGASDERVQISLDGTTWVDAKVDPVTKTWSYDNTANKLADGSYNFSARIIDVAGNTTAPVSHTVVINTAPLEAGTIKFTAITDDTGVAGDFKTNDKTLIISGEVVKPLNPDEKVQVSLDGGKTWVDAALDRATGTWSYDNTANSLADGTYTLEARVINNVGITSPVITQTVVVDTVPSAAVAEITAITTDTATAGDFVTSDNTLVISGRILNNLAADDKVQVSLDGGTTWVDAVVDPVTHTWSLDNTASTLADGSYQVQARVIDVVGNVGTISSKTVVIDTQASTVVSKLDSITDDTGVAGDFATNDNTLEFNGSLSAPLAAGDKVQISLNGGKTWRDVTVDPANNTWSYDNTDTPLADGTYKFQTRVIDQAGNIGQVSAQDVVIDTRAPLTSAVFTGITEDTGVVGDYITNDNSLILKGKITGGVLTAGDTVQVSLDGGTTWVDATVDAATRTWSYDNTANPFADGTHTVIARVVDKAGNPGAENAQDITVDTTVSSATSELTGITRDTGTANDFVTSDNTLVFNGKVVGTLAADERVQISLDGGATWKDATVDSATGAWTYNNAAVELADGSYTVQSRVIDTAGNTSQASSQVVVIDTAVPAATATLTAITDDTGVAGDFITQDGTLIFQGNVTGTLAVEDKVQISVDGGKTWTDVALDRAANTWSFDNSAQALADGTYHVQTRVIDSASNVGQVTAQDVVINNKPSVANVEFTGITEDSGVVGDYVTNDNTLVLNGKVLNNLAATDRVEVSLDGGKTWVDATVDRVNHTWSYDNTANALVDGDYTFQARVVDVAGVLGTPNTITVKIDTVAPPSTTTAKLTGITDDTGTVGDFATSDNTLLLNGSITGQLETTDKVVISLNGGKTWVDATVDHANNTWSYDNTANALADGTYKVQVRVDDQAGNKGVVSENDIIIDSKPPVASALFSGITEDTGVVGDYKTNDTTLVFNGTILGTVAPTDGVEVSLDGGTTWTKAILDPVAKTWTLDHTATPLTDGTYDLAARVFDQAGNTGPISTQKLVIDSQGPTATSEFTSITEDTGTAGDYQTNDQTLVVHGKVTGTLATDEKVQVSLDGGKTWLDAVVDRAANTWSYDNTANPLAEGSYDFQTRVVDNVLNGSAIANQTVVIDLTPPPSTIQIAFTGISDDTGTPGDYKTSDTTLIINGKIEAGTLTANDHIEVSVDGGKTWATATVDTANNTWSLDNTANALTSGTHQLVARVVDQVGNVGHQVTQDVIIVTEPPKATADLASITDDSGIAGDFITNDTSLVFKGNVVGALDPDESVQVSLDGGVTWLGATLDATGKTWSLDHTATDLAEGKYTVVTRVIDSTGTAGTATSKDITIDKTGPVALTDIDLKDDVGTIQGTIPKNGVTDDTRPDFSGKASTDTPYVNIYDNGNLIGTATVQPDGTWTYTPSLPLGAGPHSLTAAPVDVAGNLGPVTTPWAFDVIGAPPPAPAITNVVDNVAGGLFNETIPKDGLTNDKTPTVSGTAQPNTTVFVYEGTTVVGSATVDVNGSWSIEVKDLGVDGDKHLKAEAVDAAGQHSPFTGDYIIKLDTLAPAAPDLAAADNVGQVVGPIANGTVTDDGTPTFSGKGEVGSTITLTDNGVEIGTATVQPDGTWNFTPTTELVDGAHVVVATQTDAAGNKSAPSNGLSFEVDKSAVNITITATDNQAPIVGPIAEAGITNDDTPVLSGTSKAGAVITITDGANKQLGQVTADATGNWSLELAKQADGAQTYTATAKLLNGNTATASIGFTIDTQKPTGLTIDTVTDDVGLVQGTLVSGARSDDQTPTLAGKAEANSIVTIYENNLLVGSTTATATGTWSYTIPAPGLTEGAHALTATQTDKAGNVSDPTSAFNVIIDVTAPTSTAVITAITDDNGTAGDFITNDKTLIISGKVTGTLDAGDKVQISLDGGKTWVDAVTKADGSWSYDNTANALADGTYKFEARVLDAAGIPGVATPQDVTIDTVFSPSSAITLTNYQDNGDSKTDFYSNDSQFTLNVTGEAGAKVVYQALENGVWTDLKTATIDATNQSTYNVDWSAQKINDDARKFRATVTDTAGNTSTVYVGGADEATAQVYRVDNVAASGTFSAQTDPSTAGGLDLTNPAYQFAEAGVRTVRVYTQEYRGAHTDVKTELTSGTGLKTDANGKLDLSSLISHSDNFTNLIFETVDVAGNAATTTQFLARVEPATTHFAGNSDYVNWYYSSYDYLQNMNASAFMETKGVKFYNDSGNLAGFASKFVGSGFYDFGTGEVAKVYLTLANGTTLDTNVGKSTGYWEFSYNGANPIPAGEVAALRLVATTQQALAASSDKDYHSNISADDILTTHNGTYYGEVYGVGSYSGINGVVQYIKGQADTGHDDWHDSVLYQEYISTRDNDSILSNGIATTLVYKVLDTVTAEMNSGGAYLGEAGTTIGAGYGSQYDLGTFGNSNTNGWIDRNHDDVLNIDANGSDFVDVNGDGKYDGSKADTSTKVTDLWNHFDQTQDKIDISDWVAQIKTETGITITDSNIGQFLHADYVTNGNTHEVSTVLSIDRDGAGTKYAASQFLTLEASGRIDLADLLQNNIILH